MTTVAPWVAAEVHPEHVIAELRRRFPWAHAWWGEFTGQWWAIFRDHAGHYRLIEAPGAVEMGRLLEHFGGRAAPRFSPTNGQTSTNDRTNTYNRASTYDQTGAAARTAPTSPRVPRAVAPFHPAEARHGHRRPRRRRRWPWPR